MEFLLEVFILNTVSFTWAKHEFYTCKFLLWLLYFTRDFLGENKNLENWQRKLLLWKMVSKIIFIFSFLLAHIHITIILTSKMYSYILTKVLFGGYIKTCMTWSYHLKNVDHKCYNEVFCIWLRGLYDGKEWLIIT